MDFISHMPSPRSISNHFIVGSTPSLFILPKYLSNFGAVSRRHLKIEEEFFLSILPVLPKIHGSSFISSSRIISVCQIFSLNHPEYVRSCFSRFFSPEVIISATITQLSRCFVQVFFNHHMISLYSCILIPSSIFVLL